VSDAVYLDNWWKMKFPNSAYWTGVGRRYTMSLELLWEGGNLYELGQGVMLVILFWGYNQRLAWLLKRIT
jgi:hypothetical protein